MPLDLHTPRWRRQLLPPLLPTSEFLHLLGGEGGSTPSGLFFAPPHPCGSPLHIYRIWRSRGDGTWTVGQAPDPQPPGPAPREAHAGLSLPTLRLWCPRPATLPPCSAFAALPGLGTQAVSGGSLGRSDSVHSGGGHRGPDSTPLYCRSFSTGRPGGGGGHAASSQAWEPPLGREPRAGVWHGKGRLGDGVRGAGETKDGLRAGNRYGPARGSAQFMRPA